MEKIGVRDPVSFIFLMELSLPTEYANVSESD